MQHEILGAQHQSPLDLASEAHYTLLAKLLCLAADIDQVAGVNDQRTHIELCALRAHPLGLLGVDLLRPPHPRTGRKDLQCIGADLVRPIYSIGDPTRRAQVHSDSLCHFPILTGKPRVSIQLSARPSSAWAGKRGLPQVSFYTSFISSGSQSTTCFF